MRARRSRAGLTIFDGVLLGAVAVLGLLAWWPSHSVRGILAAEDDAMETIRDLAERLDAHRAAARLDEDRDGRGETPSLDDVLTTSDDFRRAPDAAAWEHRGYWFTVLVPGADGLPTQPVTGAHPDRAEATYVLLAWPTRPGESGMRAYLRTPLDGLLRHAVDGYPYAGPARPPAPQVSLAEPRNGVLRPVALRDGRTWIPPRETMRNRRRRQR